jgi:hypothetical protein
MDKLYTFIVVMAWLYSVFIISKLIYFFTIQKKEIEETVSYLINPDKVVNNISEVLGKIIIQLIICIVFLLVYYFA